MSKTPEVSLTQMPWNFKIFYGLLLDRLSLLGSRRKGWILGQFRNQLAIDFTENAKQFMKTGALCWVAP